MQNLLSKGFRDLWPLEGLIARARELVIVGLPLGHAVRRLGGYVVAWICEHADRWISS